MALIVLFLPLFGVLGLLVLADDGCPIIFRRRVLGPTGEFDAFKRQAGARRALQPSELQRDCRVDAILREIGAEIILRD